MKEIIFPLEYDFDEEVWTCPMCKFKNKEHKTQPVFNEFRNKCTKCKAEFESGMYLKVMKLPKNILILKEKPK